MARIPEEGSDQDAPRGDGPPRPAQIPGVAGQVSRSPSPGPARGGEGGRPGDRGGRSPPPRASDEWDRQGGRLSPRGGRGGERGGRGRRGTPDGAPAPGGDELSRLRAEKAAAAGPAGGVYVPPFRLARMLAASGEDRGSEEHQRLTWDRLRKAINRVVNKVNAANLRDVLPEVFAENLIRGKGLMCRALIKSQLGSQAYSPVYAALVAVVNTKLPEIGELLLHRLVVQFKRSYRRNDKAVCSATLAFLAHLMNQGVVHEVLVLEVLTLLLEQPTDDSVELAVALTREAGATLQDLSRAALAFVLDRFRAILHEGSIDRKVQYLIEGVLAVARKGFAESGHPARPEGLDLVEEDDQITHDVTLEDKCDPETMLNVFRFDPEYAAHEEAWGRIQRELLGEGSEEESGSEGEGSSGSGEEESGDEGEGGSGDDGGAGERAAAKQQRIADMTQTNLVNLRRTIYLTIMSALDFEEAGHKLLKIHLEPGQEIEVATMILECCSNEKMYNKFYGLLGQRFCQLKREYQASFEDIFRRQYALMHRLATTGKIRNVAKFFSHLLSTDAISWAALEVCRITEDDTTSSSRIFLKFLFQELSEYMGVKALKDRLDDPQCAEWFAGLFPADSTSNLRFAINFFTLVGLGGLTDKARALFAELPRILAEQQEAAEAAARAARGGDSSESDSSSLSSTSSETSTTSSDTDSSTLSTSSSGADSDSDSDSAYSRRRARSGRSPSRDRRDDRSRGRDDRRDDRGGDGRPDDRSRDRRDDGRGGRDYGNGHRREDWGADRDTGGKRERGRTRSESPGRHSKRSRR